MFKQFISSLNCHNTASTFVVEQVDILCLWWLWCLSSWELAGLEQRYCTIIAVWASVCTKSLHKAAMRTACHCDRHYVLGTVEFTSFFVHPCKQRDTYGDIVFWCALRVSCSHCSVPKAPVPYWSHSLWFFKLWIELSWTKLNPVTDSLPHFTMAMFVDFVEVSGDDMAWHCQRQAKVLMQMQPSAMGQRQTNTWRRSRWSTVTHRNRMSLCSGFRHMQWITQASWW